jgi:hypothetical protein
MSGGNPGGAATLVFDWVRPGRWDFRLLACIGFSLLLHALSFYVFQVVYPPAATIFSAPTRISLLLPDSPENAALLRWLETADPALMTRPLPVEQTSRTPALAYVPSFANAAAPLREIDGVNPALLATRPDAGPVKVRRTPRTDTPRPAVTSAAPRSALRLSGDLAGRAIRTQPEFDFKIKADSSIEPPVFLVAVNASGEVGYAFLQRSSGDNDINQACAALLRRVTFEPGGKGLTWGFVTIEPGTELYAPREEVE